MKEKRREIRAANQQIEEVMSQLRTECFYLVAALVDDALQEVFGFGDIRRARLWGHVKGRAIWKEYMEKGLPLHEVEFTPTPRKEGGL